MISPLLWASRAASARLLGPSAAPAFAAVQSMRSLSSASSAIGDHTVQRSLLLKEARNLALEDVEIYEPFTTDDVRIEMHSVGICRSDLVYYDVGEIPPFFQHHPMILGHEGAGVITEVGENAAKRGFYVGQRVCMEPGVPDFTSTDTLSGHYNRCKNVRFWATPPPEYATLIADDPAWKYGHGCLRSSVVHPAAFTFPLPDNVPLDHGALVEPLAVGMHAATQAQIKPGEKAAVIGVGPIGMVSTMSALAGGCASVVVLDQSPVKVKIAESISPAVTGICVADMSDDEVVTAVQEVTGGGADVIFECAGASPPATLSTKYASNGARIIIIGCHAGNVPFSIGDLQVKELKIQGLFRYAGVYPAAINLLKTGRIDLEPIITRRWEFEDSVEAFDFALHPPPHSVKNIIQLKKEA